MILSTTQFAPGKQHRSYTTKTTQYILKNKLRILDLGYNESTSLLGCSSCGTLNSKINRIDTIDVFNYPASFCISCWADRVNK